MLSIFYRYTANKHTKNVQVNIYVIESVISENECEEPRDKRTFYFANRFAFPRHISLLYLILDHSLPLRNLISPFVAVLAFAIAVMLYCAAFNVRTVTMNIAGRAEETPIFSSSDVATEFRRNVVESPSTAPPSSSTKEFEDYAFDYSSCVCSLSSMSHADVYKEQLSLVIPWLNLTTRQALERNHPNFPVNLLKSFDGKWCSLLPLPHL